jgi:hypothetical protein
MRCALVRSNGCSISVLRRKRRQIQGIHSGSSAFQRTDQG